jgi:hypothetical protein
MAVRAALRGFAHGSARRRLDRWLSTSAEAAAAEHGDAFGPLEPLPMRRVVVTGEQCTKRRSAPASLNRPRPRTHRSRHPTSQALDSLRLLAWVWRRRGVGSWPGSQGCASCERRTFPRYGSTRRPHLFSRPADNHARLQNTWLVHLLVIPRTPSCRPTSPHVFTFACDSCCLFVLCAEPAPCSAVAAMPRGGARSGGAAGSRRAARRPFRGARRATCELARITHAARARGCYGAAVLCHVCEVGQSS